MDKSVAQLYRIAPDVALARIRDSVASSLPDPPSGTAVPTFFRADDIGVPSHNFAAMTALFAKHRLPLCLAVVPAWLTASRWEALRTHTDPCRHLWCWHQHGWNHTNHERVGKKCEFGPSRPDDALRSDLMRGRKHLEKVMGTDFSPFFTPPWNRCSGRTLELLDHLGYHAISRSGGEQRHPAALTDCFVNVDLHTRKEPGPAAGLDKLSGEFSRAIQGGRVGIMLHHQRMNTAAFTVLDGLLQLVAGEPRLQPVDFNHFLKNN